ncbi:MAG: 50S ribosomal protein L17 [Pelagibacteraceae bacterium]|nr:50S ribosomal protein L17 [Pelagibacteraceae bacterium]|tara:strand:+ start:4767 stop:5123 length:357 start_codon:yes stop_codon:yes gene_type:complete
MKHLLKQRKLNRTSSHRLALLRNLSISLIKHETITTTTHKAKELRPFIEKLVTKAKKDTLANRRLVLSTLFNNQEATSKLFSEISKKFANTNGGYTRIIKKGNRVGDFAHTSIIQFIN